MPRYIDADALISKLAYHRDGLDHNNVTAVSVLNNVIEIIERRPTISPDEVRGMVHCGECKFWRRPPSCEGLARCETGETGIRYRSKNDFCSRGVKMEVIEDA